MDGFDPSEGWSRDCPHRLCLGGDVLMAEWMSWSQSGPNRRAPGPVGARLRIDLATLRLDTHDGGIVHLLDDRMPLSELTVHPRIRAVLESRGPATIPWYLMA